MRIRPKKLTADQLSGFKNDIFGFKTFAEQLTDLVQNAEHPSTIVLDGGWGTGKSVFIQQWIALAQEKNTVIYFDAFAVDYQDDAFLAIAENIAAEMPEAKDGKKQDFIAKTIPLAKRFLPIAAKAAVKIATAGLVSTDAVGGAIADAGGEASDAVSQAIQDRLTSAASRKSEVDEFRESLKALAEEKEGPLIIVIDELDRCNPTFALSVLERIKHFYDAEGVCFLLVTNLLHMANAVEGQYGNKINGAEYMQKFYDYTLMLPPGNNSVGRVQNSKKYLHFLLHQFEIEWQAQNEFRPTIEVMIVTHDLSLRDLEKIISKLSVGLLNNTFGSYDQGDTVACLLTLYVKDRVKYLSLVFGQNDAILDFFKFENWNSIRQTPLFSERVKARLEFSLLKSHDNIPLEIQQHLPPGPPDNTVPEFREQRMRILTL